MSTETKKSDKTTVRANDYKIIFVNAFRMRASQNDVALTMAIDMENEQGEPIIKEEIRAMITPRSAKVLMLLLQAVVADIEKKFGPIELPPGKAEEIAKSKIEKRIDKSTENNA